MKREMKKKRRKENRQKNNKKIILNNVRENGKQRKQRMKPTYELKLRRKKKEQTETVTALTGNANERCVPVCDSRGARTRAMLMGRPIIKYP